MLYKRIIHHSTGPQRKNHAVWAACGQLGRFTQLEADPDLGPPLMHAWMLSQILMCFWCYFSFSINFIWFIHFILFPFALFFLFSTAKLQAIRNRHNTWFCNSRCMLQMPDIFWLEVRTATDWFEAVARVFCCSISWSLKFVSFAQAQCPATDDTDLDVDAQINRLEEARWAIEKSFLLAWSSKSIQCTYRTSQIEQSNELWRHVRDIDWLFV